MVIGLCKAKFCNTDLFSNFIFHLYDISTIYFNSCVKGHYNPVNSPKLVRRLTTFMAQIEPLI